MKKWLTFILLTACTWCTSCDEDLRDSCDEDLRDSYDEKVENPTAYGTLCVHSGGEFIDGTCVCKGVTCSAGDVCNSDSKACPTRIVPEQFNTACSESGGTPKGSTCICSDEQCPAWQLCVDNQCPKPPLPDFSQLCSYSGGEATGNICTCKGTDCEAGVICNTKTGSCPLSSEQCIEPSGTTFEEACKASGGEAAGGICVCNGVGCNRGVICNFNTNNCADTGIHEGDSCTGNGSQCINNDELEGKLIACNGSSYKTSECKDSSGNAVSCHDDKCGTCKNYTNQCINQPNEKGEEIGFVQECQEGVPGKTIAICLDVSCRTDIPSCGECINGSLKCSEDNDNNAIMYRCVDGRWERIRNPLDPFDPDYACPANCREGVDPQKMLYECDTSQCDKCDPCWGELLTEHNAPSFPNPCYDEKRCEAIKAQQDKDYPPFRDFETSTKMNDYRAMKKVHGYDFTDHIHTNYKDRVHYFYLDLTNETRHVSCKSDGSYYGVCHNSLQICINEDYHTMGYIVQCSRGELAEYLPTDCDDQDDPNCNMKKGDGIACHCQRLGNQNASGCCYTRHSCFKNTTATSGIELCQKPIIDPKDTGNYYDTEN